LGEPTSKRTEIVEDEEFFESDDGTMKVPNGSTIHVWAYEEGPHSYAIWFASNSTPDSPANVVYMHMKVSVGRTYQVK
jgi:hypothetical protein